jgi:hypothetical protein
MFAKSGAGLGRRAKRKKSPGNFAGARFCRRYLVAPHPQLLFPKLGGKGQARAGSAWRVNIPIRPILKIKKAPTTTIRAVGGHGAADRGEYREVAGAILAGHEKAGPVAGAARTRPGELARYSPSTRRRCSSRIRPRCSFPIALPTRRTVRSAGMTDRTNAGMRLDTAASR